MMCPETGALFDLVAMKLEEDLVLKSWTDEKIHFVFQQKRVSFHKIYQNWTHVSPWPSGDDVEII